MMSAALLVCALAFAEMPASEHDFLRISLGAAGGASAVVENGQVGPRVGAGPTLGAHWHLSGFEAGLAFQSLLSPGDLSPSLESLAATFGGRIAIDHGFSIAGSIGPALQWAHFNFYGVFGAGLTARAEVQQRVADEWAVGLELGAGGAFFASSFAMAPAWLALTLRFVP